MRKLLFNKRSFCLIAILLLSGLIYFYKLDKIPSGFYVDEASVAYNAHSIINTGKDEYGFSLPLYFRLMGSYTPSLYIYLSAFLIKFFGSSLIVFRSISAVSMIISVFFFYLLTKKLNLYKKKISVLLMTFFYSITPWIVFNARLGYETTFGFMLFTIGIYLLFSALTKPKHLVWSMLFLSISTYVSHNQRFLTPLFIFVFIFFFRKIIFKKSNRGNLITTFVVGLVTQIPNILMLGTNAFWIKNEQFGFKYFWNFLQYLSPKTIFYESGDIDLQHTIPGLSIMYNWMVIPYFIGTYLLIKNIKNNNFKFLTIYSVVSLIPAVFSGHFLSTQRMLTFAIPLVIVIGLGVDWFLGHVGKIKSLLLMTFLVSYSLIQLIGGYFILFPKERADAWNYGYDKVANYIKDNSENNFLFDNTRNPRAYILLLYYLDYPPSKYQKEVDPVFRENYYSAIKVIDNYHFSNVETRQIDWSVDPQKDLIIIGDPLSVSAGQAAEHSLTMIDQIKNPAGNILFNIYRTNP